MLKIHQKKGRLRILLLFFIVLNSMFTFGQISIDIDAPSSNETYFGGEIEIPEIIISEGTSLTGDIGKFFETGIGEFHSINITAPTGFKISSMSDPTINTGNIVAAPGKPTGLTTTPLKSIQLTFRILGEGILDEIYLKGIVLTPDSYSASITYSGKLKVELFLNGSATATPSKTFPSGTDDYDVMEVSVLDIT